LRLRRCDRAKTHLKDYVDRLWPGARLGHLVSLPTLPLVTPAKAGVQLASDGGSKLDSGLRRNDDEGGVVMARLDPAIF
jgi:hypothetical protein